MIRPRSTSALGRHTIQAHSQTHKKDIRNGRVDASTYAASEVELVRYVQPHRPWQDEKMNDGRGASGRGKGMMGDEAGRNSLRA